MISTLLVAALLPCIGAFKTAKKDFQEMYKSATISEEFLMGQDGPVSVIKVFRGPAFVATMAFVPSKGSFPPKKIPSYIVLVNKGECLEGPRKYTQWLILPSVLKEKK